jgi:hypothetical protein
MLIIITEITSPKMSFYVVYINWDLERWVWIVYTHLISHDSSIRASQITKLKRADWTRVRSIMGTRIGRARRFSAAFLRGERDKLSRYRRVVRRMHVFSSSADSLAPPSATLPPAHEFPYQVHPSHLSHNPHLFP